MTRIFIVSYAAAAIVLSNLPASADYTIVLKNGRQIHVQNFREAAGMIKFYGFGGEIGIVKDQIRAVRHAGPPKQPAKTLVQSVSPSTAEAMTSRKEETKGDRDFIQETTTKTDTELTEKAKEEQAYQEQVKQVTDQLKELRDRYAIETRGNKGSDPVFFTTEQAFKGHQEDLLSRLRDAQYKAQGLPAGQRTQSPPLSANPPPAYTERQKSLSELRGQLSHLERERERLIQEMKQKHIDSGSMFLE